MSLKLFQVDVESFVVVLAEDAKKAENFVKDASICGDLSSSDVLEGSWVSAREIKSRRDLDSEWIDSEPFIERHIRNQYIDDDNDDLIGLTCGEIISKWEEAELERLRKKAEEERFDKLQGKFDFAK
jgi:hypothetical protein